MKKLLTMIIILALVLMPMALAEGTLQASGSGTVLVESDMAIVTLSVVEYSRDVREAQNTVNEKIAAVRAALLELGLDNSDINTDSINIWANYDYSGENERIIGYNASDTLSIRTTDIDKVGTIIDTAFAAGANQLSNIQFSCQDISEAQKQALQMATKSAMEKARIIAEAAGTELKSIKSITEDNRYDYVYDSGLNAAYARVESAEDTAAYGTDIQAAMLSVSANVTVVYEIDD